MIAKIKYYASAALATLFILLFGYGRYQKRKAEKLQKEADELNRRIDNEIKAQKIRNQIDKKTNKQLEQIKNDVKSGNRDYFDNNG